MVHLLIILNIVHLVQHVHLKNQYYVLMVHLLQQSMNVEQLLHVQQTVKHAPMDHVYQLVMYAQPTQPVLVLSLFYVRMVHVWPLPLIARHYQLVLLLSLFVALKVHVVVISRIVHPELSVLTLLSLCYVLINNAKKVLNYVVKLLLVQLI
jgi:hypothetical protein